jgi:hypothetical protein
VLRLLYRQPPRAAAYAAVACLAAALCIIIANSNSAVFSGRADAYCVGEWLINYAGGFVRRGLGGALILSASEVFGLKPRLILFAVLAACYTTIFVTLAAIALRTKELTFLDLLLIVSPFAALFPAFHQVAGQRKEVLLFAMAALAYVTGIGALDSIAKYVFWSVALGILVAVHDGLVFFLPLFILYLRVLTPSAHPVGMRALALGLPALVVFVLGYAHSSHVDIGAICALMEKSAPGQWCIETSTTQFPFAASWLRATALDGMRSVAGRFTVLSGAATVLAGAVGLVPVALAMKTDSAILRGAVDDLPFARWFPAVSCAGIALLFVVANDWNRWFYIVTSLLTMIHFAARKAPALAQDHREAAARGVIA